MEKKPTPACTYCNGATTLAMHIDRLGNEPAMDAFKCQTCQRLSWRPFLVK